MNKILEIKGLKQVFHTKKEDVVVLENIDMYVNEKETLALVGESGSGKSTLGRCIIGLYEPESGDIIFEGEKVNGKKRENKKDIQMIFQDPFASINPRLSIDEIIAEGLEIHFPKMTKKERHKKVEDLLLTVGLNKEHATRYPHEFSGGQLQRVGIARALAVEPKFIIADESISALDVSIQAQIINLFKELQEKFDLTYLFIAHDLSIVQYIADRVAVMYNGKIVEIGSRNEIFKNTIHPYTKSLLSAIPNFDINDKKERIIYDSAMHNNDTDLPKLQKINETHMVLLNDEEYQKILKGESL